MNIIAVRTDISFILIIAADKKKKPAETQNKEEDE